MVASHIRRHLELDWREEMPLEKPQALDDKLAELFREGSPISTHVEPLQTASVQHTTSDEPLLKTELVQTSEDGGNATTIVDQTRSVLAGLNLDTAIRLRWALRDIKAKRTKLSPVSPSDLAALIELDLAEMQNEEPVLTIQGDRALE
jgi:hypothetical protein